MAGISQRQGVHHVAHTFSSTTRPRSEESDTVSPASEAKRSSGAGWSCSR